MGGNLNFVNGIRRNCLVRLNIDGTLDPTFNPDIRFANPNGGQDAVYPYVSQIVIQNDGKIVIFGFFDSVNGVSRNALARLNADGTLDTTYNPGLVEGVLDMLLQTDGKIVVAGFSTMRINGITRSGLGRINTDGSLDTTLTPQINSFVRSVAVQADGQYLISGSFTSINGISKLNVARLSAGGILDAGFGLTLIQSAGFPGSINKFVPLPNGQILIGGGFTTVNGVTRRSLARINSDGSVDPSFDIGTGFIRFGVQGGVFDILLQSGDSMIVSGSFSSFNGVPRNGVVKLSSNGVLDSNFVLDPIESEGSSDVYVESTVSLGSNFLLVGTFKTIGGNYRNQIGAVTNAGTVVSSFAPVIRIRARVWDTAVQSDGKVVVVGDFLYANGQRRNTVARLNANGTVDATFNSIGPPRLDGPNIRKVAVQNDNKILVAGFFGRFGGSTNTNLTRLNADGSSDSSFNFFFNGPLSLGGTEISDIIPQSNGKILICGDFTQANGIARRGLARLNSDGSTDATFPEVVLDTLSKRVYEMELQPDGRVLISGDFLSVNGTSRAYFARLNSDGTLDTGFVPPTLNGPVYKMTLQNDNKVLIAGAFTTLSSISRRGIARLNPDGSFDPSFNPGTGVVRVPGTGRIHTIKSLSDGGVFIGGDFNFYDGVSRSYAARLNSNGALDTQFVSAASGLVWSSAIQPNGDIIIGGDFTYVNGQSRPGIARLLSTTVSPCVYTLAPVSPQNVVAQANTLNVNVSAGQTCQWTATSNSSWITVTNGSAGSGNGAVTISIAQNTDVLRTGSLTIAGQNYVVNQSAAQACTYSVNPVSATIPAAGATRNFEVISPSGCPWDATSNVSWIGTNSIGVGNGVVTYVSEPNSGSSRSGTISIGGQLFTVNQLAGTGGVVVPAKVSSADSLVSDFFGNSVSISGNTAIVGAQGHQIGSNGDQGAAYIFVNNGSVWQLQQKLVMPVSDAQASAQFGYSVAISGDTVIVGSPTQDNGGNTDQGAAYVYVRSGTTWTFQQRLRQSDGAPGDNFGWSVALDGNTAVVGAYLDDESIYTNCGSAYAYLRTGTTWQEESRMVSSERTSNSQMGYSVAISGDTVLIGARFAQTSAASADFGSAYIFTPVAGTPRVWTQRSILTAPQRSAGDQFGFSVGVSGNTALIGSRFDDVGSNIDQGSAYVFTGSGFTWTFQRQLFANDGTANDEFGNAVSISGDKLVVGAPQDSSRNGRAYLFTGVGSNWTQLPVSVAPDGSAGDLYGSSVSISGSNAVIGAVFDDARRGSVYFLSGIPSAQAKSVMDFDGDGKTDLSIFRPNGPSSEWWWLKSSGGNAAVVFGANTDTIVPADYTGDGKTDIAFWRPSNGNWFVLRSEDFSFFAAPFGANGDVPVPGDFDGDGKADLAVFRPSTLNWFINKSSGGVDILTFGAAGDKPVPGDFDGDGKADIAIYRPTGSQGPAASEWWVRRSSNGVVFALQFGSSTDKAVPGDYTGDGKTDVAFWRPANGNWFVLRSEDFSFFAFPFGANGDTAVPGDYDGDGRWDAGVFRPSNNTWFVQRSTAGTLIQQFGITGDVPLPSAYVR
ncbi:MAG: VCBS repeat-containing protein [Blastocatellia bacterium]|nr:VCBS repeat-containing protein [Blastocatellia bacterium]